MLGSFKIRMLLVIVLVTLVGIVMETNHYSRDIVEPTLKYIMQSDNRFENVLTALNLKNTNKEEPPKAVPTSTSTIIQIPCEFKEIKKNYGWYWNSDTQRQEFSPGIYLSVENNTLVKPILRGRVEDISGQGTNRTVTIKHNEQLFSLYGGLKEVLVEIGADINITEPLGKSSTELYFELRNQDGPLNPQSIFR